MALRIPRTAEDDAAGPVLDLSAAIAEFYQDFPEHQDDVFILNHQAFANEKEAIDSIAPRLEEMKKESAALEKGIRLAKSMALGAFAAKMPCSVNVMAGIYNDNFSEEAGEAIRARIVIPAGGQFTARVMKSIFIGNDPFPNTQFPVMAPAYNNTEVWQRYVLDHELGHAVTQLTIDTTAMRENSIGNKSECEADAYAMIRHFQRYGAESTFPHYIRNLRNMSAAHKGDITHWTSRAIDIVIGLNAKGSLKTLTPHQARDLAVRIAEKTQLSLDADYNMTVELVYIRDVAAKAKRENKAEGDLALTYVQAICTVGAMTKSPAVLEVCKRYMTHYASFIPQDAAQTMTPAQLQDMARNLKILREKKLAEEPPMPSARRAFNDRMIDAQYRKKPKDGYTPPKPPSP